MLCVATASDDGTLRLWDGGSGVCRAIAATTDGSDVNSVAFSPNDVTSLLSASDDFTASIWDLSPVLAQLSSTTSVPVAAAAASERPDSSSASSSESEAAARSAASTLVTLKKSLELTGHGQWVRTARFSSDATSSRIVTASFDGTAKIFDATSGKCLATFSGHSCAVNAAAFSPPPASSGDCADRYIATASFDQTARLWDAQSGRHLQTFRGHSCSVTSVEFSPADPTVLVTASLDMTVKLWDVPSGACTATLRGHSGRVHAAVFSADGQAILSASADKTARLWSTGSNGAWHCDRTFEGHDGVVLSVASLPLPDSNRGQPSSGVHQRLLVATASEDTTARLWDSTTGACLQVLSGHSGYVLSVALQPPHLLRPSMARAASDPLEIELGADDCAARPSAAPAEPVTIAVIDDAVDELVRCCGALAAAKATIALGNGTSEGARPAAEIAAQRQRCCDAADRLLTLTSSAASSTAPKTSAAAKNDGENAAGDAVLLTEERDRLRRRAETVLAAERSWAGNVGLQRRHAAVTDLGRYIAARKTAERAMKRTERALRQAALNLENAQSGQDSDDGTDASPSSPSADDDPLDLQATVGDGQARADMVTALTQALRTAETAHEESRCRLLAAVAKVQEWATTGEGARALEAFPGDSELSTAFDGLTVAELTQFGSASPAGSPLPPSSTADADRTVTFPETPGVVFDNEYPGGLQEHATAPGRIFFAERVLSNSEAEAQRSSGAHSATGGNALEGMLQQLLGTSTKSVVLRRLPLSGPPDVVASTKRQLQDARRITIAANTNGALAAGCADTAAGFPVIVAATRWFIAPTPGSASTGSQADLAVWLEFPRAAGGTLAEVLQANSGAIDGEAALWLCVRLARGVARLHAAGLRHGDLNPSNIVLWDVPRPSENRGWNTSSPSSEAASAMLRPGIIDLLDTVSVGATQTLRAFTAEWLPPEAKAALAQGRKIAGSRALDCWQLGRICAAIAQAAVGAGGTGTSQPSPLGALAQHGPRNPAAGVQWQNLPQELLTATAALWDEDAHHRCTAADALLRLEALLARARSVALSSTAAETSLWAVPPGLWHCRYLHHTRGSGPRSIVPGLAPPNSQGFNGADLIRLNLSTDPAALTLQRCAAAVNRRVRAVYRIENIPLWHVYAAERARLVREVGCPRWPQRLYRESAFGTFINPSTQQAPAARARDREDLERTRTALQTLAAEPIGWEAGEAVLLHGAPPEVLHTIANTGFDPSFSGDRCGGMFGRATCLTPLWCKAANDYASASGGGVFVTRVAVGRVWDSTGTPREELAALRRPPEGFDTVLGDNGSPGAVVAAYRPSRMYPEYLIVFE